MVSITFIGTRAATPVGDWCFDARLGYAVGGTAPIGMPATIRGLNSYSLRPNLSVGIDVSRAMCGRWWLMSGLRIENKGMKIDAEVKNYHMTITQGGEQLEGYFTGNDVTEVTQWMVTVPFTALWKAGRKVSLYGGPYVSLLLSRDFSGYVYDGYLRVGDPTGDRVEMGHDEGERGTYDFSDNMRRFQTGIVVGAKWQATRQWGLFADLSWGLTGIHKSSFKTIEQTLYPIYGTIGVSYKIKD